MNAHAPTWKTFAPSPVWSGSVRSEVQFTPLSRRQASKIFHDARRFERQTATPRIDAFGRRHTQGKVTRMGLLVLHALVFDFLNYGSGRLDPSYQAIAVSACISARSAARGLAALKRAGVLTWLRRCTGNMEDGRYQLVQDTNAYAVQPQGFWQGFQGAPVPPPPDPASWGATPPLPSPLGFRDALAVLEAHAEKLAAQRAIAPPRR